MSFKLMYITNNPMIAQIAESNGVDWIFVDLEINGKEDRQGHLDTVISKHTLGDVKKVRRALNHSKLLVRINPIYSNSQQEINDVIESGADIIMLPFFKTSDEVKEFVDLVDERAEVCLLLETPEAVNNLDEILSIDGVKYVHIGLNDLHLGYEKTFMFELLADGTVERICSSLKQKNVEYGFGGIAELGEGDLPAEYILGEHYRLGSNLAILARTFCNTALSSDIAVIENNFAVGVSNIRKYQSALELKDKSYFEENKEKVKKKVKNIISRKEIFSHE